MRRLFTTLFLSAFALISFAQESDWGIKFNGFVKADYIFDSRQVVSAREQHFFLYPAAESLDAEDNDINAHPSVNMLAIQSRLTGKITGPDAFGAKTSAVIEGAFFGNVETDINGFRLRHAYLKLNWETTELLMGQYWNPFFITQAFPGTVNFNTGVPFQPFSRNPQIRLTKTFGGAKLILAALDQRDFTSLGPTGASTVYLRNNVVPDLHAQIHFGKTDGFYGGIGVAYKSLVPTLKSTLNFDASNEKASGISAIAFMSMKMTSVTWKAEAFYGQNTTDLTMIGGYAVSGYADEAKAIETVTPQNLSRLKK